MNVINASFLGLSLAIAACSHATGPRSDAPPGASAASEGPSSDDGTPGSSERRGPVLARVLMHDAEAVIHGGVQGTLQVVVRRRDGTMVADGITLEALRTREPELYVVLTSAVARAPEGGRKGPAPYVDATLDLAHRN